jgi:hypothetical protein
MGRRASGGLVAGAGKGVHDPERRFGMITCTVCGEELPFGGAFMVNTAMVLEGRSVMFVKAHNITYPEEGGRAGRSCS